MNNRNPVDTLIDCLSLPSSPRRAGRHIRLIPSHSNIRLINSYPTIPIKLPRGSTLSDFYRYIHQQYLHQIDTFLTLMVRLDKEFD